MADLTAIILTYNEELNIESCITSLKKVSERIIVVDSYSSDNTVQIASNMGVEVFQNTWTNHAQQFQYGLEIANIKTQWIIRLDADESLTEESAKEIEVLCKKHSNTEISGLILRLEVSFLGKKLRHGGIYPIKVLRIFKYGHGNVEIRNMDEHIVLNQGKTTELKSDSIHNDFKSLTSWIDKHNRYSSLEVIDYFQAASMTKENNSLNLNAKVKRIVKYKIYYRLPMGVRALLYFIYRYIFKLGFLDGKEGLIFTILQAFWYRFLVDAKIHEELIKKKR